ncbi:MAG: hypothetical protein IJ781_10565 [Atopobiaceae bacterium]|nr:hypothetical protein [Atopobiaceae bacterium]
MAEDMRNVASTEGMSEFERGYAVPDCVVLDSAYCSMGRMVAVRACKEAGWTYHDTVTLLDLVPECGVTPDDVDAFEAKATAPNADLAVLRKSDEYQRISSAYRLAAERALAQGHCLIHDRVDKAFIQSLGKTCASAMTYASDRPAMRVRAKVSPLYAGLTEDAELDAAIAYEDAHRRAWHALGSDDTVWGEPATYDLMINTDQIGRDFAARLLAQLMVGQR